ncbi:hypothetical protein [Streptomyces sp. NPDC051677]|uniref:hypothetical protein n=1 Tax=Streptomyces sp. NPDC051677 TaxID=3365669 RepID=UPI0037CF6DC2
MLGSLEPMPCPTPAALRVLIYEVNLKAVWSTTEFAAPCPRRSPIGPAAVNTASVSGLTGFPTARAGL